MARCRSTEIMRIPAVDLAGQVASVPAWASTVVVQNPLATPVYCSFRTAANLTPAPGPANGYDFAVPGAATYVWPVPSEADVSHIAVSVDYPGAVPAGDAGLFVIVTAMETQLSPGATPMA